VGGSAPPSQINCARKKHDRAEGWVRLKEKKIMDTHETKKRGGGKNERTPQSPYIVVS